MKILSIYTIVFFLSYNTFCQSTKKVELSEYVNEIQKWSKDENKLALTFWIPSSYWSIALQDNPEVNPEMIQQIEMAFQDYVIIIALDMEMNLGSSMVFRKEPEMRKSISIIDYQGNKHFPLKEYELGESALMFKDAIKPMFAQMLGKMGQGMNFYFFKVQDKENNNLINEFEKGKFTVRHSDKEFEYLLPLSTLLPKKKCPVDNVEMNGSWNYCPKHGAKLDKE
jgi:hypothetical protein